MKKTTFKTVLFLSLMLGFVLLALLSNEILYAKFYASIAIITGASASHFLTFKKLI